MSCRDSSGCESSCAQGRRCPHRESFTPVVAVLAVLLGSVVAFATAFFYALGG